MKDSLTLDSYNTFQYYYLFSYFEEDIVFLVYIFLFGVLFSVNFVGICPFLMYFIILSCVHNIYVYSN